MKTQKTKKIVIPAKNKKSFTTRPSVNQNTPTGRVLIGQKIFYVLKSSKKAF